jgi:hypothetical protein
MQRSDHSPRRTPAALPPRAADSPFGPLRKRRQPRKPNIPAQRPEPDPLPKRKPPAGITPLSFGRPPEPRALAAEAQAEVDDWYELLAAARNIAWRLATPTAAHDTDTYRSAA